MVGTSENKLSTTSDETILTNNQFIIFQDTLVTECRKSTACKYLDIFINAFNNIAKLDL